MSSAWSRPGVWRNKSRVVRLWRLWRTRRPATFNDKVRYKLLRDHRPLVVTFADKLAVRDRVASLVGADHLPRLLAVVEDPADLLVIELPESYVLKPTHGSGACVVVSRAAGSEARLPRAEHGWVYAHVRPEHADRTELAAIARGWLSKTYGRGPNHEWAYGQVVPRVLVEELLTDEAGGPPDDVKLFVFHGRCRFVQVDHARFGRHTADFFTDKWEPIDLRGGHPRSAVPPPRPDRWDEVVRTAEALAQGVDFVRVDLYLCGGRVLVGELTSAPAGGDSPFDPPSWNQEFGRTWEVPRTYR